jgi:hypothetical protein
VLETFNRDTNARNQRRMENFEEDNYMRQELENRTAASASHWLNLHEKVCVVTGTESGINVGNARAFANFGAHVATVDRDLAGAEAVADGDSV